MDGVRRGRVAARRGADRRAARYNIALRDRAACASQPELRGFDVVALRAATRAVLVQLIERCERLDIAHGGIQSTLAGDYLDIPDPDGTVLRFYHYTGPIEGFTGVEFRDGKVVRFYDTYVLEGTAMSPTDFRPDDQRRPPSSRRRADRPAPHPTPDATQHVPCSNSGLGSCVSTTGAA